MKFTLRLVMVLGLVHVVGVPWWHAATLDSAGAIHPIFESGKPKLVKLQIENDLAVPVDLNVGEKLTTLQPGQVLSVRLAVGARVTVANALAGHPLGEVIVQVDTFMADALVHLHA